MKISLTCDSCNKQYDTIPSRLRSHKNHYCSKLCKDSHHKILYGSKKTKEEYFKEYYAKNREKKIAQAKERYAARPEEKRRYDLDRRRKCHVRLSAERRARYKENKGWEQVKKQMLSASRTRAKKQGVPFAITIDDIVIPDVCPVLGIKLEWNEGRAMPNSPSLDKIIPHIGYVKGNIAVISCRANKIKNNASKEEIIALHQWIISVLGS